ncbi:MAG TPA: hypothetical protein VNF24_04700 [Candidatus Acidoferrales bacterium]|nr:hypothetical protein [Candidatus Acidoferrales bacterium]
MDESTDLEGDQRHLVEVVYDWYRTKHRWPSLTAVALRLDQEHIDIEEVMGSIPADILGRPQHPFDPGQGTLSLTLKGMSLVPEAIPDLNLMVMAIGLCWAAASATPPESLTDPALFTVTSDEMREMLSAHKRPSDPTTLATLGHLLQSVRGLSRSGSNSQEGLPWGVSFDVWELRRYRHVHSVDDLLSMQAEDARQRERLFPTAVVKTQSAAIGMVVVSGSVDSTVQDQSADVDTPLGAGASSDTIVRGQPFQDPRYLFVMMPSQSRQEWSERVYGWIIQVCRSLVTDYPGLNWHTATELIEAGQIPDQVRTEIARAGLLLADLTSNNPNVLYEVGFAHGAGKGVIFMNQDLSESPFDLSVHRQIEYNLENEYEFRENLNAWLRKFLGEPDPAPSEAG